MEGVDMPERGRRGGTSGGCRRSAREAAKGEIKAGGGKVTGGAVAAEGGMEEEEEVAVPCLRAEGGVKVGKEE